MGRVGAPTTRRAVVCPSLSPGTSASTYLPRVPPLRQCRASRTDAKPVRASGVKTLAKAQALGRGGGVLPRAHLPHACRLALYLFH